MACSRNMLNMGIIVILIFIIFAMLYRDNIYRERFHSPYNGIIQREGVIGDENEIIKGSKSLFDYIKNIFK